MKEMDIILGLSFLRKQEAILNFKEGTIALAGFHFEIGGTEQKWSTFDKSITEKTTVFSVQESTADLDEAIKTYKLNNPTTGTISGTTHDIFLDNYTPIKAKPYPIPLQKKTQTEEEIKRLLSHNIIRPSMSSFAAPAYPIYKKNHEVRLIIDYRKLNSVTIPTNTPLPPLQDVLRDFHGATHFSQIDLRSGYYQIPVNPEHQFLTSFVLGDKQYEFLRMPFGLTNAPRTSQNAMNNLFNEFKYVAVYLDDIVIFSTSFKEHKEHVKRVLDRLKEHSISINFEKSSFNKPSINYLAHIISKNGILPDISRVSSIENFTPKTKKQIRKVVGFLQWFRNFIPQLSKRIHSITEKTKADTTFSWTNKDSQTVKEIIDELKQKTLLQHPDLNSSFVLQTDASDYAIGAALLQNNKPIGFFSAKLSTTEQRYSIVEKETYAILRALRHFKTLVFNSLVHIETDNANLIFNSNLSKRINRWKLEIEELTYTLTHLKGENNLLADTLSRLFYCKEQNFNFNYNLKEISDKQNM
eukprot:GAHX01000190.1.p1 GENE.GAHX01000190.1~~GAHX01000190.1.p1  ORF type:complete len:526 (+),score=71.90 GAHX01000190.1:1842-3419(+)